MSHPFPYSPLAYSIAAQANKGEWQATPPKVAELSWRKQGPYSEEFLDCYYSPSGGRDESRYVFIEGCSIAEHIKRKPQLSIAELGFGTGLNFFTTLDFWVEKLKTQSAVEGFRLHYTSIELFPFSQEDFAKANSHYSEYHDYLGRLLDRYPAIVAGVHRIEFPEYQAVLDLVLGDVQEFLPLLSAGVDAWYLDGFTPTRNERMWSDEVFAQVFRLTNPGGTLSTFSAATAVKNALTKYGFEVEKRDGFASKREMITARLPSGKSKKVSTPSNKKEICIIGAGLAGAALAWTLARRGFEVLVLEERSEPALEASGNAAGVLMPYLSVKPDFLSRFYLSAFQHSRSVLKEHFADKGVINDCGVLRLATSARLVSLLEKLPLQQLPAEIAKSVDAKEGSELAGLEVLIPGIWHELGAMVYPKELVTHLLSSPRIKLVCSERLDELRRKEGHWQLNCSTNSYLATDVILANAYRVGKLSQSSWLPLEPVKGELLHIKREDVLKQQKSVLCFDGYLLPFSSTQTLLGASYQHGASDLEPEEKNHLGLLQRMQNRVSSVCSTEIETISHRAAFRTMSPDRLPSIGSLPSLDNFEKSYLELNDGKLGASYPLDDRYPGLYLSLGHGSRGICSCLFAAEIIASMICRQPLPLESDLFRAVDPARFLVRALKKSEDISKLGT